MEMNRVILRSIFEKTYRLLEAENGEQALAQIELHRESIAVVLLDIVMPVMDGFQVMQEMSRRGMIPEIPVIIITAEASADTEVKMLDLGASEVIMKPFEPQIVRRRIQNTVELNLRKLHQEELIEEQASKLRESSNSMISALSSVIESRSMETGQHTRRISLYTKALLEDVAQCDPEYLLDEHMIDVISSAASMHDIGKIAIPDAILNKPGPLTAEEYAVMKTHTVRGCEILNNLYGVGDREFIQYAYNICRYHHERWDGRGYPERLKGDGIPICAQAVGIADCYDALTTDRVYKKAIPAQQAFSMIVNGQCGTFSPKLLESLKNVQETFMRLSRELSDTKKLPAEPERVKAVPAANPVREPEVAQSAQLKYYALMKYMNAAVMEADLGSGIYHVVYLPNGDFDALKSGASFEQSMRRFAEEAVHPDDRERFLLILGEYAEHFFQEGLMQIQRSYRIYNKTTDRYLLWQATMLRINVDAPQLRKVMLIWKRQENVPQVRLESVAEEILLQNVIVAVQIMRNDRQFTMPEVSAGLLKRLGYTREEVQTRFGNRYADLICPDDLEEVRRQIVEQMQGSSLLQMEYRVAAKDGSLVWLRDISRLAVGPDGEEQYTCVLLDATDRQEAAAKLKNLSERYRMLLELAGGVVFERDFIRDTATFSRAWKDKFGYPTFEAEFSKKSEKDNPVHPEDRKVLEKLTSRLSGSSRIAETEIRLADSTGKYHWCRLRFAMIFNEKGKTAGAVGVITDIDAEKQTPQRHLSSAERDSQTILCSREAAAHKIDQHIRRMKPEDGAALFVVEVRNFGKVNDRYGHILGDSVLQDAASELARLFRSEDVFARTDGDEFLIFMNGAHSEAIIARRAEKIVEAFQSVSARRIPDCPLSCRIGIALCPSDGKDFAGLYTSGSRRLPEKE